MLSPYKYSSYPINLSTKALFLLFFSVLNSFNKSINFFSYSSFAILVSSNISLISTSSIFSMLSSHLYIKVFNTSSKYFTLSFIKESATYNNETLLFKV